RDGLGIFAFYLGYSSSRNCLGAAAVGLLLIDGAAAVDLVRDLESCALEASARFNCLFFADFLGCSCCFWAADNLAL
ncbi:hypothetical protein U1Q18_010637, partial [Sarracenia purpurea var. burkii]